MVRQARAEILAEPLPASRGPVGCLVAIAGLLLLGAWPSLRSVLPGGEFASPFVGVAGVLLVGSGLLSTMLVGRKSRAAAAAVEAALRQLEQDADRETELRAATLLLTHAFVSDGPGTTSTFRPEDVAARISTKMPMVLAVQELLCVEVGAWRPFE